MLKTLIITSLIFLAFVSAPADSKIVSTHDLSQVAEGKYKVIGIDPYIVIQIDERSTSEGSDSLQVDFGNSSELLERNQLELELFFKVEGAAFSPFYKALYSVEQFPVSLELPNSIGTEEKQIRIDLVGCSDCVIDLSNDAINRNAIGFNEPLKAIDVQNGITKLATIGQQLNFDDWLLNDINGDIQDFSINGVDPYLVSPKFRISTHEFAGVYIELSAPRSKEVWDDYELFYQTERHGFAVDARSTLRLASRNIETDESERISLFIPMGFLSKEIPSDAMLERLRLDIPSIKGQWSLKEVKLVHQDQLSEYSKSIPKQLFHIKQQQATGLGLIKKSLLNVWRDKIFVMAYALLTFLVFILCLRAFRKAI